MISTTLIVEIASGILFLNLLLIVFLLTSNPIKQPSQARHRSPSNVRRKRSEEAAFSIPEIFFGELVD